MKSYYLGLFMNLNKTSIALAIIGAFASNAANAISYDSTYAPSGNIDLSQYDNVSLLIRLVALQSQLVMHLI